MGDQFLESMAPIEPYPPRPSILSEMPSSQNPEMRSLPDEMSPEEREAILRFAQDIQSPEYRQAMLMALSGVSGAPRAQEAASRGILDRASSLLRGSPEESALSDAANAAYKARYTPDEWAALMRHWEEFNQPAKIADYVPTRAAAKDTAAPIEGILNALKFSLGFDRPKTAAMARMAR